MTTDDRGALDGLDDKVPASAFDPVLYTRKLYESAPLEMTFPAEAAQLAPVRKALRGWLGQCQLPTQMLYDVLIAVGEACANAIEHGHRDNPGDIIHLRAESFVDSLRLTITDSGRWKTPEPEANTHRGRGTMLMRALMEQVTILPGSTGTTVDMHTRIP